MSTRQFRDIPLGITGILMVLLLRAPLTAQETVTPWQQFEQASMLYKQHTGGKQVIDLLKEVQRTSKDSVLNGRAILLTASVYQRENQPEKALLELQKFSDMSWKLPQSMAEEAWLRIAMLYLKKNDIRSARSYLNKILSGRYHPFYRQEALLGLAWIAADQEEWMKCDSLIGVINTGNAQQITDERIIILNARSAIAQNQPEKAISLLENSQTQAGLYYLARAHEMAGNRIMAVSVYKKLHDMYPNTAEAQQALFQAAEVFMRAGDWLAARSEFKRLLQSGLVNEDGIHFRLGWIYMKLNDLDNALAEFRYPPAPENVSYFKYMEAECLRLQGNTDPEKLNRAILLFHNLAAVDLQSPLAPLAKLKAALAEMAKGDSTGALVSLRQFISLYPKDELSPAVYFLLGVNENPRNSQRYFDQIVQQNRNSHFFDVAYFALQNFDFRKNDYQKVITRNASIPKKESNGDPDYWQRANHLLMGESAYFLKHYDQAQQEYDLAEAGMMDDLAEKASLGKAWCQLQVAGPDVALPLFKALRKDVQGVNKRLADYGYATVLFYKQDYTEALKSYPVFTSIDMNPELAPLVIRSLYRTAQCYYRLQYYVQAIETWDKLANEFPNSELAPEALFNIGDVYFRANHFNQADSVYEALISRYPDNPLAVESTLKLGQSAYNAGEYEAAVARYQKFIEQYPQHEKNKEALEGIQLSYYQLGQIDQASETLKKVIEQTSNSDLAIDARYRIAVNHYEEKNYQAAIEAFKEILTLYPNSSYAVDAQFALSKCYIAQNDYKSATEELIRFVQYFPGSPQSPEAYFLLGVGYFQTESYLSAIDYFSKVINQFPESEYYGPALKNLAWCYDRLKDNEKALAAFKNYAEKYPSAEDLGTIKIQIARLLFDSGKTQESINMFESLRKSNNTEICMETCYRLGMIYISQDQTTKAEKVFQMAVSSNSGDNYYRLSALAQLAAIYEGRGDAQKAITTYELLASSTSEERWTAAAKERINMLQLQTSPNQ